MQQPTAFFPADAHICTPRRPRPLQGSRPPPHAQRVPTSACSPEASWRSGQRRRLPGCWRLMRAARSAARQLLPRPSSRRQALHQPGRRRTALQRPSNRRRQRPLQRPTSCQRTLQLVAWSMDGMRSGLRAALSQAARRRISRQMQRKEEKQQTQPGPPSFPAWSLWPARRARKAGAGSGTRRPTNYSRRPSS